MKVQEIKGPYTVEELLAGPLCLDEIEKDWNGLTRKEKQKYQNNMFYWAKNTGLIDSSYYISLKMELDSEDGD